MKEKNGDCIILTKKQVAELFQIHSNSVRNWVKDGILTPYYVGKRVYFLKSECLEVLFSNSKRA